MIREAQGIGRRRTETARHGVFYGAEVSEHPPAARSLLQKPSFGQLCNGCGFCCRNETCLLARTVLGTTQPCPALERSEAKYRCGLVSDPDRYLFSGQKPWANPILIPMIAQILGIGVGCDSSDPEAVC